MTKPRIRPVVVDQVKLNRRLNAAAQAQAAAMLTTLDYERFDKNTLVNALAIAVTSEPGLPSIRQDHVAVDLQRRRIVERLVKQSVYKSAEGPQALLGWLKLVDQTRAANLARINAVFREASEISNKIEARLRFTMNTAATVQFGCTVAVAAIPLFIGAELALSAAGVGLVYGIAKDAIKDTALPDPELANAVAIDTGKNVVNTGRDLAIDRAAEFAGRRAAEEENLLMTAEREIEVLTRRLARDLTQKKSAQLSRRLVRAESAGQEAARAATGYGVARTVGKVVPVVFAGLDIVEAAHELADNWQK